jgi:DNA-binding SARP family transcriptional activator
LSDIPPIVDKEQAMSQLQLMLLGIPVVKHGEETLTFSTRKAQALLTYLAVQGRGGMHLRKTLSEAFWPELDAEHGRAALRASVLELRTLLERPHSPGEQNHLLVERERLAIDQANPPILDLGFVEPLSKQTGEALADEERIALLAQLEQASRMVRGPFLAGFTLRDSQFFDDWTRQQREYWHLRIQQLFETLSSLSERAGERELALDAVNRWLAFDPLAEEGYRRLMRLRFALGDRIGALRAYATCRSVLADELEAEPEPQTTALAKRIRHTAPFHQSSSHPVERSIEQASHHLLNGSLLGRSVEFSRLIESYRRVQSGQPHLVLLQGESGIGKTRLASEFVSWTQAQGATVLAGRALQTGRPLPYQPLIDLLRHGLEQEQAPDELINEVWLVELSRLLPELRDRVPDLPMPLGDEELGHHRLFEAIARLLRRWAARRPLVLLLDDLQWADTGTLDLLLYLACSLAEQPAPVLLLLTLRTGTESCSHLQDSWLLALKRTYVPLTEVILAPLSKEETYRFVQALAWAEPRPEAEEVLSTDGHVARRQTSICPKVLASFADWLYAQTCGQPFYLVEILKELLARNILLPSAQEKGREGLVLRFGELAGTPAGEFIPTSVRELIRCQLTRLTSSAWALLVSAAALDTGLTFERLCQVAQADEQTGLYALEELLHSGLLCEGKQGEKGQAFDSYHFPGEMIREVVYQEAGATRQRLIQRRVSLLMEEEAEHDHEEQNCRLHPAFHDEHTPADTSKGQQRWVVAPAARRSMRNHRQDGIHDASEVSRRFAGNRCMRASLVGSAGRDKVGQGVFAIPRSPPGSPHSLDSLDSVSFDRHSSVARDWRSEQRTR